MKQFREFFNNIFDTSPWPSRWDTGNWSEFHGWLYIISDLLIFAAYFAIPFLLINFIIRKKNIQFPKLYWLFGIFIFACGITHLVDALIFWIPVYKLSALVRFVTALISWAAVFALYRVLPDAFSLKTPLELEKIVEDRTRELEASIDRTKFIADAMPQIVWTAKPDGAVDYVNVQSMKYTGLAEDALLSAGWQQILHPDDFQAYLAGWEKALTELTTFEMEVRIRNTDGTYHWFLTRALPHFDDSGKVLLWVGTCTEIEIHKRNAETLEKRIMERTEELREVNQKLIQSNNDLENFASVASHDLQAPLRTITTYLSMLEEKNESVLDEQSKRYISRSVAASGRMRNLIENLLTYSKLNGDTAYYSELDLNETVGSVLSNLHNLIEERHAEVVCNDLPLVVADEIQMEQLFQNLIANGINYNDSSVPRVEVVYEDIPGFHKISISDNGTGIEEAYLQRVFDVFTRLDAGRKGTGLGLAICQRIVRNHDGEIWATSRKGEGSTFTFTISKNMDYKKSEV